MRHQENKNVEKNLSQQKQLSFQGLKNPQK